MTRRGSNRAGREALRPAVESDIRASRLRLFGVALLCAQVVVVPLAVDPAADAPFTVPKVLLSHGLAYVLAAVIGGLLIRFGRSFVVWSWLHVAVAVFLAANVLATAFAVDPFLGAFGTHPRMLGLGTIADWVVLYLGVVLLIRTRVEAFAVIGSAFASSAVVVTYELMQAAGMDPFHWSIDASDRPFSTIGQATSLGQYLSTLAVGAFAVGLLADELPRPVRILAIGYGVVLLAGAALTGTRSPVLGVALGGLFIAAMLWTRIRSSRVRLIAAAAAGIAALGLVALVVLTPLGARALATVNRPAAAGDAAVTGGLDPSLATRLALYNIALRMVAERPVFGYGPDNFALGVPKYRPEQAPLEVRESAATSAHSWIAYVTTGSGLVGLAAFLSIAFVALALVVRNRRDSRGLFGAALMCAFLGTGLTTIDDITADSLFWLGAGFVALGTARRAAVVEEPTRRKGTKGSRREQPVAAVIAAYACVAAGVLLLLLSSNAFAASRLNKTAQDSRLVGRVAQAIDASTRATAADAGRAEYWHTLGLAYVAAARWPQATTALDRASGLAPYDIPYMNDAMAAQFALGASDSKSRALALAEQAVRTDPNNPRSHLMRATAMQATGNLPEALRSAERALVLDPASSNPGLYVTAAQIYRASGRTAGAVVIARQGLLILGRSPQSVSIRLELARALVAAGQPRDALAELDIALAIQPNDPSIQRLRDEIRGGIPQ